jgi:hypothetical protein
MPAGLEDMDHPAWAEELPNPTILTTAGRRRDKGQPVAEGLVSGTSCIRVASLWPKRGSVPALQIPTATATTLPQVWTMQGLQMKHMYLEDIVTVSGVAADPSTQPPLQTWHMR